MKVRDGRGFSTLEIMVAMGLLGLLTLAAVELIKNIGGQQSAVVAKDDAAEFVGGLSLWLGTDKGCKTALVGQTLAPGSKGTPLSIAGYTGFGPVAALNGGSTTIQAGYRITNNVTIKALTMRDKGLAPVTIQVNGVNYRRIVAQIQIDISQNGEAGAQAQRSRFIEVPVLLDNALNVINLCNGEPTLVDLCSAMGSVYNAATGSCTPQVNCTMQGTYMNLTCSPSTYGCYNATGMSLDNAITHAQSCPAGAIASQTGVFNYSHQVDCGKKCTLTVADTLTFFICMRCN
jgi:hypothetical protein